MDRFKGGKSPTGAEDSSAVIRIGLWKVSPPQSNPATQRNRQEWEEIPDDGGEIVTKREGDLGSTLKTRSSVLGGPTKRW